MKKVFIAFCFMLTILLLTGCSEQSLGSESKGNCDVLECIKKLNPTNTYEEVNQIIGFEGELNYECDEYKRYRWFLNDVEYEYIEVVFFTSSPTTDIYTYFKNRKIENKNVDFSKYNEVKALLDKGESISYDQIKEYFGGVDGTLSSMGGLTSTYKWVSPSGAYLNVSFNKELTRATFIFGQV